MTSLGTGRGALDSVANPDQGWRAAVASPAVTDTHVAEFRLSITQALADQLERGLKKLKPHALTEEAISNLERRSGIYLLFHTVDEEPRRVYVGKAQQPLPTRLRNHYNKLRGREKINLGDISFTALYVANDLDAAAPERLLIRDYRDLVDPNGLAWNVNGFGNKDPGRERDSSAIKKNHFDALYPINLDLRVNLDPWPGTVGALLSQVKADLPYNLRFQSPGKSPAVRADYQRPIEVPAGPRSVAELMGDVVAALPPRWQVSALPGYIILYPEVRELPSARTIWRSPAAAGDEAEVLDQEPAYDAAGEVEPDEQD